MKKILLFFPIFLFCCGDIAILPSIFNPESNEPINHFSSPEPVPIEVAKNRCFYQLNYKMKSNNKGKIEENIAIGYSHGVSTAPGRSYNSLSKQNEVIKHQCDAIMNELYFNIPNINFNIYFERDKILSQCKENRNVKAPSNKAYLEFKELPFFGMKNDLSYQRFEAILDCQSDFEMYCVNYEEIKFFSLKNPIEPCIFTVEKQPLKLENGSTVLLNLEGKLLELDYETTLEINHISFD